MLSLGLDIGGTSIKAALLRGGVVVAETRQTLADSTSVSSLSAAVRSAFLALEMVQEPKLTSVGVCMPGLWDEQARVLRHSVNIPALNNMRPDDWLPVVGGFTSQPVIVSDAHAAAYDIYAATAGTKSINPPGSVLGSSPGNASASTKTSGSGAATRLLVASFGTGVGMCIIDDGKKLEVAGHSSGHLGQVDVGIMLEDGSIPIGPDGGRGGLEGYVGAGALSRRYGSEWPKLVHTWTGTTPPVAAVCKAFRIAHAIYRPHQIWIVGGVGLALESLHAELDGGIRRELTNLARPEWSLRFGTTPFHAARGAARLSRQLRPTSV
jgi:predicted NBD/HSP70 family sugar kinase